MNWISVKDEPPPIGEPVLVYGQSYGDKITAVMEIRMSYSYSSGGEVPSARIVGADGRDLEEDLEYEKITHWMQLPAQPE